MKTFRKRWNHKAVEDCGAYMSDEAKSFARAFRNMLKRELSQNGINVVNINTGHYYLSGFVEKDKKYVYINYEIPRGGQKIDFDIHDYAHGVLYRSAESDNDYHGGPNHFCSLKELPDMIRGFYVDKGNRNNAA